MDRKQRVLELSQKRDELRKASKAASICGFCDGPYYQNEIELISIMTHEELDSWASSWAPAMAGLVAATPGEPKRTLVVMIVFMFQSISLGRVGVASEVLSEGTPTKAVIQPTPEDIQRETETVAAAKVERRLTTSEPADAGPDWDKVGLSLMARSWTTSHEAAEALQEHLGRKKGLARFSNYTANMERLTGLVDRLNRGEIEGWAIRFENGKQKVFKVKEPS